MRTLWALPLLVAFVVGQEPIRDLPIQELTATVRNESGGLVTDLTRDDFILEENGISQPIVMFSRNSDMPVSWGILLSFLPSTEAVGVSRVFLRAAGMPGDEFVVMAPYLGVASPFTSDTDTIDSVLIQLYGRENQKSRRDPMSFESQFRRVLSQIRNARYARRGLLVLGALDLSPDLLAELRAAETPVFIIGFNWYADYRGVAPSKDAGSVERQTLKALSEGEIVLKSLAEASGGGYVWLDPAYPISGTIAFSENVSADLRGQYRLGYRSTDASGTSLRTLRLRTTSSKMSVTFRHVPLPSRPPQ